MSSLQINPFEYMTDQNGDALDAGFIYIGVENLDPETNPISVYYDSALTQPVSQPIRTVNGYVLNAGSPANLYVATKYSVRVRNRNLVQVYYFSSSSNFPLSGSSGASNVGFLQTGTGAILRTVQSKLEDVKCVFDFFTVAQIADVLSGSATLNVTTAITTALAAHRNLYFPAGTYLVSAIFIPANTNIVTSGLNTKFKQISGTAVGTIIVRVNGSNVSIGDLSLEGNIATDTNEQNHGLMVQSTVALGNIENVYVGDVFGKNIRGDVIYFGQQTNATSVKNVHFGHITFDNEIGRASCRERVSSPV